ncbi:DUF1016 domain-containing protein [Rhodococcus sp. IEGM 248]|nr:DUF1016 domain-containing protein [Rhodococcus sp. IEGM 248]
MFTQWQTTSISAPTSTTTSLMPSPSATASPLSAFDLGPRNPSGPYNLDVLGLGLGLDAGYSERELEDALIGQRTHFLSERGGGFTFLGCQPSRPASATRCGRN